jgi:hypothetical protein
VARDVEGNSGWDESPADLVIQSIDDNDRDGLSDDWELLHFGDTTIANGTRGSDQDGDGCGDLSEFLAGTVPTDRSNVFRVGQIERYADNGVVVSWETLSNRVYTLFSNSSLSLRESWVPIYEIEGSGRPRRYIRSGLETPTFFRLKARPK